LEQAVAVQLLLTLYRAMAQMAGVLAVHEYLTPPHGQGFPEAVGLAPESK
jgi:hypothetical protein